MKNLFAWALALLILSGSVMPILSLDEVDPARDPGDVNLFQFARIRYNGYVDFLGMGSWGPPPWAHDYPRAEKNFLKILLEVTSIQTTPNSYLVLDMDDPLIMNYPILYVSEPGYWNITDEEAANLRAYLSRGGFVIFDDFRGIQEWENLTDAMKKVLPERNFQELTLEDPIFHCFSTSKHWTWFHPMLFRASPGFTACSMNRTGFWPWPTTITTSETIGNGPMSPSRL